MPATGFKVVAYKDVTPPLSRCIQATSLYIDFTGTDNLWDVSNLVKCVSSTFIPFQTMMLVSVCSRDAIIGSSPGVLKKCRIDNFRFYIWITASQPFYFNLKKRRYNLGDQIVGWGCKNLSILAATKNSISRRTDIKIWRII